MAKEQTNLLIDSDLKERAKKMIKLYKHKPGQPMNLSELVNTMLGWYVGADEGAEEKK